MSGSRFMTEKNYFSKIQQNNHQLEKCFELRKLVYLREDKDTKITKNIEPQAIVRSQILVLIETILQKRQRDGPSVLMVVVTLLNFVYPFLTPMTHVQRP